MARPSFIELPVADTGEAKAFHSSAFGWKPTDFGRNCVCTMIGDVGLQRDVDQATKAVLAVIAAKNVEAALQSVLKAGGAITRPTACQAD
jgi:predicted enzyme related to lactoylglutathione lyase